MAATDKTPTGRKADKVIRDALIAVARQDASKVKRLAEKWWEMALEGDLQAMDKLTDRLDGKVAQAVIGDKNEDAIQVEHRVLTKEQSEDLFIAAALKGLVKEQEVKE
jgi:3-phosphoglycerate kinase